MDRENIEMNHKFARLANDRLYCYKAYVDGFIPRLRNKLNSETDGRKLRKIRREYAEAVTQALSFWDGFKLYAGMAGQDWSES